MKAFEDLSTRGQMRRYHQMARMVLEQYPLTVKRLRCLTMRYNIIFRVDADEGVFALRISPNQHRTALQVRSEMQWVEAICKTSSLSVACPVRTIDDNLMVDIEHPHIPDKRNAVIVRWLYGKPLRDALTLTTYRKFGQAIGHLHTQSQAYHPQTDFMTFDDFRIDEWGDLSYLEGTHPLLTPAQQGLFKETIASVLERLQQMRDALPRLYLIHGDATLNNTLVYHGKLSLFDFDDCRWGHFGQDLAVPLYRVLNQRDFMDAFLQGYTDVRPLPCEEDDIATAIRHRAMWGANFVLHYRSNQPELVRNYLAQAVEACHFQL